MIWYDVINIIWYIVMNMTKMINMIYMIKCNDIK